MVHSPSSPLSIPLHSIPLLLGATWVAAICCLHLIPMRNLIHRASSGAKESYFCCRDGILTIHILLLPHAQHFSWPLRIFSFWSLAESEDSFEAYKRSKTLRKSLSVTYQDFLELSE